MAKLETSVPDLTVLSSKVGHITRQVFAGLVYMGIIAAFASVVFIGLADLTCYLVITASEVRSS